MNTISEILRGLVGLFVDDQLLTIGVLGVVGLTALLVNVFGMNRLRLARCFCAATCSA